MEITENVFDQLAHLSRLQFNEAERAEIKTDLQRMISFVDKLNEVDTTGVPPLLHMSNAINVWREDKVTAGEGRDQALLNAPEQQNGFFQVPKVIKK
ncbi:Asp-tRNA(Asn)/Glu-tRNA(Gln) amidotransferase subunit GatC [Filimonas effusa]|uniref:Aspartyl/glutamyl-tRNA(Asn/Gln) amidotransferase subunit C n=1 Tax=Filimonas effusa TaxID=2508721 RepID=A0A4Q1D3S4_9BACT|nr:Asp-tRNA(Asn)/Glu-tRNA(Gln) amidotransferase subunit GatC [Filimonas effusa]RXK83045.1 Asp-tRNA(Asn)/Glu-tRNA(Gln) amidotransferase subunit GatC [Filimonas effusa]